MATTGYFPWPPAGTSTGHQWVLFHGHGHLTPLLLLSNPVGGAGDVKPTFGSVEAPSNPGRFIECRGRRTRVVEAGPTSTRRRAEIWYSLAWMNRVRRAVVRRVTFDAELRASVGRNLAAEVQRRPG